MDRQDVPDGNSCFADLKPIILKVLGSPPSLVVVDLGQVSWMNSTSLGDRVFNVIESMERGVTYLRTGRKPGGI